MSTRVVSLEALASRVRAAAADQPRSRRYLIGIAGPPAAGKSTLSLLLRDALNEKSPGSAQIAPMDGFHKMNAQLAAEGSLRRKGEPDTFDVVGFVKRLREVRDRGLDRPVPWPTFDRALDEPTPADVVFDDASIAVVEGNYLLLDDFRGDPWSGVRDLLDEVWFIDAADDVTEDRLLERHLAGGKSLEEATAKVRDSDLRNAALVRETRSRADLVLREESGTYFVISA